MSERLNEVWDYLNNNPSLGEITDVKRGALKDQDRPTGECWPCGKFADEAMIHESPGTAKCCQGCDAYKGI